MSKAFHKQTTRVSKIGLLLVAVAVVALVFVVLMYVPDGSGTYKVTHEGIVTYHILGWYTVDNIQYYVEENKLINMQQFLLWSTGELVLTISMSGPAHYSTSVSLGVIHDPIFDTTIPWTASFLGVLPGNYQTTYTLMENGAVKASRTIIQAVGGETT